MMNRQDFENAINDYLINSGQAAGLWDVWGASIEMRGHFEVESIDDVDPDEFVSILQKYDFSSEFTDRKTMTYIEKTYGLTKKAYAFKVSFYDGTERNYKSGAAADKCARRNARAGHYCALLALTDDGWEELACC